MDAAGTEMLADEEAPPVTSDEGGVDARFILKLILLLDIPGMDMGNAWG